MQGVFDLDDLALRAAIFHEHYVGDRLIERYAEPLDRLGAFGRTIEATLEAFFRQRMRIEPTARSLFVHPNTLRHRLRRFEEITGADLGSSEDLFRVWWALERRRLHR
jgi:DNA-binding PucR family transcriptional regulator